MTAADGGDRGCRRGRDGCDGRRCLASIVVVSWDEGQVGRGDGTGYVDGLVGASGIGKQLRKNQYFQATSSFIHYLIYTLLPLTTVFGGGSIAPVSVLGAGDILLADCEAAAATAAAAAAAEAELFPPEVSMTTEEEESELRLSGRAEAGRTAGGGEEPAEGPSSAVTKFLDSKGNKRTRLEFWFVLIALVSLPGVDLMMVTGLAIGAGGAGGYMFDVEDVK